MLCTALEKTSTQNQKVICPWLYIGESSPEVELARCLAKSWIERLFDCYGHLKAKVRKAWENAVPSANGLNPIRLFLDNPCLDRFNEAKSFFLEDCFGLLLSWDRQILSEFLALRTPEKSILLAMVANKIDCIENGKKQREICIEFDPIDSNTYKKNFRRLKEGGWIETNGNGSNTSTFLQSGVVDFLYWLNKKQPAAFN